MEKLTVSPKEGTEEMVIREGKAAEIREPEIVKLSGVIGSPAEFWGKRKSKHPELEAHVVYSRDSRTITLNVDEKDYFGGSVTGSIQIDPDLSEYGINGTNIWGIKELMKFLRMRRSHFTSKDDHMNLVSNLSKFKVSVATEIENSDNQRGDVTRLMEQKVKTDIPLGFDLNIRIFKGMSKRTFHVEILFNVQDGQVSLWFESPELAEMQDKMANDALDKELKAFTDLVVIEQ